MAVPTASRPGLPASARALWAEVQGGTIGSLAVLAVPLSLGLLAFAALGPAAARVGLLATFVTAALGGLVYGLVSRAPLPAAGPSSATALILASLVIALTDDPQLVPGGVPDLPRILAACGLAVALSGVVQVMLGLLGLARLARLVPRPVLAGFMNGVSLLILVGQVPLVMGATPGAPLDLATLAASVPGAVALGLLAIGVIAAVNRVSRAWPAALLALAIGTGAAAALQLLWPTLPTGPRVGPVTTHWPDPTLLMPLLRNDTWLLLGDHAGTVISTALVLGLIGGLESLLSLLALDEQLQARHDARRELQSVGLCNLVCGLLGGLPVVVLRARAVAIIQSGGRGRTAALVGAAVLAALYAVGGPLLAVLPLPVLGGIMVMVAFGLVDRWSGRLLLQGWRREASAELRSGLVVMALVCGITLWQGFAAGVAAGVLLAMVIFVARMNRSLLRSRMTAALRPSRRIYPASVEALLQPLRSQIEVWELEGALFFGNADRLLSLVDGLAADTRVLVLDLRRVGSIDETAAAMLATLGRMLQRRQVLVLLSGVPTGSSCERALLAFDNTLQRLPDADRAIEVAEHHVLGSAADETLTSLPLAKSELLRGLSAEQRAVASAHMTELRLAAGDVLFRQGDAADGLYVLVKGSVSVIGQDGAMSQRFLSISPGMMLGETAMLDGGGRSAGAVADTPALLHHLSSAALDALGQSHPAIANRVHRNIAVHLSTRLRSASAAWWASQH